MSSPGGKYSPARAGGGFRDAVLGRGVADALNRALARHGVVYAAEHHVADAAARDPHVSEVEQAADDALVYLHGLDGGDLHLVRAPADDAGLVDDALVGDALLDVAQAQVLVDRDEPSNAEGHETEHYPDPHGHPCEPVEPEHGLDLLVLRQRFLDVAHEGAFPPIRRSISR